MRPRAVFVVLVIAVIAAWVWRSQLFTVSRPGEAPLPLEVIAASARERIDVDETLPSVPIVMTRLRSAGGVLLVHYWAPWQHDAAAQAAGLDSLVHSEGMQALDAVLVCFDPFPSVARFVRRNRLRLPVLLDGERALSARLECPSVPFTYVLDQDGSIAVAQAGEVDWFSPRTRETLTRLLARAD